MGAGPVSSVMRRFGCIGVSFSKGVCAVATGFGSFCRSMMRGSCFSLVYHMEGSAIVFPYAFAYGSELLTSYGFQ